MAISKGQRIITFILALSFFFTTVGLAVYTVIEMQRLNDEADSSSATQQTDTTSTTQPQEQDLANQPCGAQRVDTVDPRPVPEVVQVEGRIVELKTTDVRVGDGEEIQPGDCVVALYYGTLATDGTRFDGNYDSGSPIEFSLNGVISGWTEGIPGMKVGGVRRLEIPAAQAYGEQSPSPAIPSDSDLIFEVEILSTRRVN